MRATDLMLIPSTSHLSTSVYAQFILLHTTPVGPVVHFRFRRLAVPDFDFRYSIGNDEEALLSGDGDVYVWSSQRAGFASSRRA